MPLEFETVAVPVVKGINVNTTARLVPVDSLLEAVNSRFPRGAGAKKRRGHLSTRVRADKAIPPGITSPQFDPPAPRAAFSTEDTGMPSNWVWGWGAMIEEEPEMTSAFVTSSHPSAGLLFGTASRDNETLLWDGFRLYSRAPGLPSGSSLPTVNAVMPALRAEAIAKTNQAQTNPEVADTGKLRVVAWMASSAVHYTVLDSETGATIKEATALPVTGIGQMRVIPVGDWVHILVAHDGDLLYRYSIHTSAPREYTQVSIGTCVDYFDVWKVDENSWVVARNTGDDNETTVAVSWHYANGNVNSHTQASSVPNLGLTLIEVAAISIAVHPVTGRFALAFRAIPDDGTATVYGRVYEADGTPVYATVELGDPEHLLGPVTLAPTYVEDTNEGECWNAYWDAYEADGEFHLNIARFAETVLYSTYKKRLVLGSAAFRVGNRTYVWAGLPLTYQTTWLLLDEELLPVGRLDFITANVPTASAALRRLASVNWRGTMAAKDRFVFHGALGYKTRVASEAPTVKSNIPVVYADPSIRFYELDFLPPLRAAQAGRTTYFAGAQVWAYDGLELTEANFPFAPEGVAGTAGSSGGGLGVGEYVYRVDLCHRNGQAEEVRSASFYTSAVTVASGETVTLTIPTVLTRREDAYFLVFRNEVDGAQWYLINSRDPSSSQFLENDQTTTSVSFVDNGTTNSPTDAALVQRELHPGNGGFGYIDIFPAPACEVIAAGHDRLWVAGGEIPAGQVHPSRLYTPGETPGFNPFLAVQVDRGAEPITAIGFIGDLRAYFRKTQTYVHNGAGPDNSSQGNWEPVRLAFADVGAISQDGLGLITAGLLFQSPAGIRLLSPGGGVVPVGVPVDEVAKSLPISGTLVCGEDQEVRFYSASGDALVYNYQYDAWSTWTVRARGAVRNPDTGLAVIATPEGNLWTETDGLWLDDGHPYKHRIRFAWLRHGNLMDFQRVRRIGAIGECTPGEEHRIHVDVYYDEREFAEEWFDWDYPDPNTQNTTEFGDGAFGDGAFGDTDAE